MAVLAQMLAVEARGGRALGADALADAVGMDDAVDARVTVSISRLLIRIVALVAAIAASRAAASSLAKSARLLQVLDPVAVAARDRPSRREISSLPVRISIRRP